MRATIALGVLSLALVVSCGPSASVSTDSTIGSTPPTSTEEASTSEELDVPEEQGFTPTPEEPEGAEEQGFAPGEILPGEVQLPIAGGIRFTTTEPHFIAPGPGFFTLEMQGELDGWVSIFHLPDMTADEIVSSLSDARMTVSSLDDVEVAGFSTRVVEFGDGPYDFEPVLGGWFPANAARLWIIQTDRGPLVVTAEATDEAGERRPEVLERAIGVAEQILKTLSLVETS